MLFGLLVTSALLPVAATCLELPQIPLIPSVRTPPQPLHTSLPKHDLKLRHIYQHGREKYPLLHRRKDVPTNAVVYEQEPGAWTQMLPLDLRVGTQYISLTRLADRDPDYVDNIMSFGQETGVTPMLAADEWTAAEVQGPNVTDKETILSLARIAANAYVTDNSSSEWMDVGPGFNSTDDFGWEDDGMRGHVFVDANNSTVVIGIKGTSLSLFDGSGSVAKDRINDNLLFSCCCGQGDNSWYKEVCNCMTATYTCNTTCVSQSLRNKAFYYHAASDIYKNVSALYPNSDIWFVGHSLGGSVSALVGLTYGFPVVTFQAPGDAMAASRLRLPTPPDYHLGSVDGSGGPQPPFRGVYHFGHTADPLFMGVCNNSPCSLWGYAMQSVCHTGYSCVWDTVTDLGWRTSLLNHRIVYNINEVYSKYDHLPNCTTVSDCQDCNNWKFYESNGTETTTTSFSTTATSTSTSSTSTCKTPGWFGCLDETTTATTTTGSSTKGGKTTITTIDPTTTKGPTTTTTIDPTTTTTCETPGWFGCKDKTTTVTSTTTTTTTTHSSTPATPAPSITSAPAPAPTASPPTSSSSSTTCETKGWFGRCKDATTTEDASSSTAQTVAATVPTRRWNGL